MKRTPMLVMVAILGACGGGGGGSSAPPPSPVRNDPKLELVSPAVGSELQGTAQIQIKATGDGMDIKALQVKLGDRTTWETATPTFDPATHSAALTLAVNTMGFADGVLAVVAQAIDAGDQTASETWSFALHNQGGAPITVDAQYASFFDEAGVQLGYSMTTGMAYAPAQYTYASTTKVAVVDGATVSKIVSRLALPSTAPSAADLGANASNVPVMRLLVPHGASDPAITSAQAMVAVGTRAQVTVDLVADTAHPATAGQAAFLLPLASNLFQDLLGVTATTDLTILATAKDALGHAKTGGPWTIHLAPLPPPVVVTWDTKVATSGDPLSTYPYVGLAYSQLWTSDFSREGGVRLYHALVTNPGTVPVVVGAILGGAKSWTLTESWTGVSTTRPYGGVSWQEWQSGYTGGYNKVYAGLGEPKCSFGNDMYYSPALSAPSDTTLDRSYSCVATSSQTSPTRMVQSRGALAIIAYQGGATLASQRPSGRYIVPAATVGAAGTAGTPGTLDLYVLRPVTSRDSSAPALLWSGSTFQTAPLYDLVSWDGCQATDQSKSCSYVYRIWSLQMTGPTETVAGTLALDAQAFDPDQSTEYGPAGSVFAAKDLTARINH